MQSLLISLLIPKQTKELTRFKLYIVFVLLHKPDQPVEYFILRGEEIIGNEKILYGGGDGKQKMSGILMGPLKAYKNRWEIFEKSKVK
jgi:hypothetical protein